MRSHEYNPVPNEGTPLDSGIAALEKQQVDATSRLDKTTATLILDGLRELKARFEHGEDVKRIVAELSRLYWQNQDALQDDDAAHIVRVLADDFGCSQGLSIDDTMQIDHEVQDDVDRRQTAEANMRIYRSMGGSATVQFTPPL